MPDETEPTPAAPTPDAVEPTSPPEHDGTARSGVRVPKWLAVGAVAVALAGGGFAVGHVTASEGHHHDSAPIGDNRPGGPGGRDGRGDVGGRGGMSGRGGGDATGPGATNGDGTGGANTAPTPGITPTTGA